jgi:hypothetical protein
MATPRIFVSHSNVDSAWCTQLVETLQAAGLDIWFDKQGLYVGAQWVQTLQQELERRDVFLIVLTPDSWASQWVQKELALALSQHKQILSVIHKPTQVSGFITVYQMLDAMSQQPQQVAERVMTALGYAPEMSQPPAKAPERPRQMSTAQPPTPQKAAVDSGLSSSSALAKPWVHGVYQADASTSSASTKLWKYLRFYTDGRVVAVNMADNPVNVAKTLHFEGKYVDPGQYHVTGNHLRFSCTNITGTVDYSGTIESDGEKLQLEWFSHINNKKGQYTFRFVPVTFAK